MKKHLQTLALTLLAIAACSALAFGSAADPAVTLSYLNNVYAGRLVTSLTGALSGLEDVYQSAIQKLGGQGVQSPPPSGWTASDAFEPLYPQGGETVTLSAGSSLLWQSGTGTASRLLLDVTAGAELSPGGALTVGHRYLAEEEAVVSASAPSACMVQGLWRSAASGVAPVEPASPFTDVPTDCWYYEPVVYVVDRGLFNGIGNGRFSPEGTMDCAMLVTVLYRLAGEPAVSGANPFTDVRDGAWYAKAVVWASQAGIVTGMTPVAFQPETPVTREQIAVMFYRFAAYYGYDTSIRADIGGYADCGRTGAYALDAMRWAVGEGLFQGAGGRLNPTNSATRCEVAALFQRLDRKLSLS